MKLYALHDKKAKSFSSFHVERSDAVASRSFAEAVSAADSLFAKYPEDFELVALCDVHDSYEVFPDAIPVSEIACVVVITAQQVLAARGGQQLSLLKEA